MRTPVRYLLGPVILGVAVAMAPAQAKSHDALLRTRAKAQMENQRVLLMLTGGDEAVSAPLTAAMADYRTLGKLLRYEYQVAAQPADSLAGTELRRRLGLGEPALPAFAVVDADDSVLAKLDAHDMVDGDAFSVERVRRFLEGHVCAPIDAREVLAAGLAEAKKSRRHAFVYLSAPW